MNVSHTGLGIDVTDAIKNFADEKLTKLERHSDHITQVKITYDIQHLDQVAEATIHVKGEVLHARASAKDLYTAIAEVVSKLDRQLIKHKTKNT